MGGAHAAAVGSLRRATLLLEDSERTTPSTDLAASVLQGLGASLLHLGRYAEALEVSDTFGAVRRLPARALSNRASALLHLDRGAEALADWDAAIAAESQDLSLLILRAQGLRRLGRGKEAAADLIAALSGMIASKAGEGAGDAAALSEVFDDAIYSLQEWQDTSKARAAEALPVWRQILELLQTAAPPLQRRPVGGTHRLAADAELVRLWNPDWAADESKLQEIREALAAGRVVQIRSAVNRDVALALQQELLGAAALESTAESPPIRRRHEARDESGGAERTELDEVTQRALYAAVASAGGSGGVCSRARAAYNHTFHMAVHGTAPDETAAADSCASGGGVSLSDWPKADASTLLLDTLRSAAMASFVGDLLSADTAGSVKPDSLLPIMQATAMRMGDHLTPHNDLLATSGSNRRIAYILQLTSDESWEPRCGGSFIWCDPSEVLSPTFNTLTLFPTSHFSWHFVEPMWSTDAAGEPCAESSRRLAWSGWFTSASDGGGLGSSLGWMRSRLAGYVAAQEDAVGEQGALVI